MSSSENNPAPKDATEVAPPLNMRSLMPFTVRCYDKKEGNYFALRSSGFLKMERPNAKPNTTLFTEEGVQFDIEHVSEDKPTIADVYVANTLLPKLRNKDLIIPYGSEHAVREQGHLGRLYNIPPRGPRIYTDAEGKVEGCHGLVCIKERSIAVDFVDK